MLYQSFKLRYLSPCLLQKNFHLLQAVFEAMSQLTLQSIFLFRTYDTNFDDMALVYFIFTSIVASLLSIVLSFRYEDQKWLSECPYISIPYLSAVSWRILSLICRFSIFTLVWTVIGGFYLSLYLMLSLLLYILLSAYTPLLMIILKKEQRARSWFDLLAVLQSIVGIPLRPSPTMHLIRFIDNLCILSLIAVFSFTDFDCFACADASARSNAYIGAAVGVAMVTAVGQPALFGVLYRGHWLLTKPRMISNAVSIAALDHNPQSHIVQWHPMFLQLAIKSQSASPGKAKQVVEDEDKKGVDESDALLVNSPPPHQPLELDNQSQSTAL